MTAIQKLLAAVGLLTQKVEAIEKTQTINTTQENENSEDQNGGGGNTGTEGEQNAGTEGTEGTEGEQNAEVTQALQAIEGLTQKVTTLEAGFSNYKADLDKTFNSRVEAASKEKLAASAGTPLQTGHSTKEDMGALSTKGLKGRALTVAALTAEQDLTK